MFLTLAIFFMRLFEVLFFIGLAGCSAVVLFSWISIFTSGFSERDEFESPEVHAVALQRPLPHLDRLDQRVHPASAGSLHPR